MTCLAADDVWPMRSMLFVPGHKLDWIRKASRYKPDALIIDLEDAVPPSEKAAARLATREGIAHCHSTGLPATVRINSPAVGGLEDIEAIASPGLTAVVVPKLRTVDEVQLVDRALAYAEGRAGLPFGSVSIVLIPETAAGLRDAGQLAAASPRVKSIMGGFSVGVVGDIAGAVGFKPTEDGVEQHYLASKLVLDSRAAGALFRVCVIVGTRIDDLATVRTLVNRARQFGFTGCALIHPSHVAVANEAYLPTTEEVDHASGLLEAVARGEGSGTGAVLYKGMMVDYAMVAPAKATLREAARRGIGRTSAGHGK